MNYGSGWWIKAQSTITDCDTGSAYTVCTTTLQAVNALSMSSPYTYSTLAAITMSGCIGGLLGLTWWRSRQRRLQLRVGNPLLAEEESNNHHQSSRHQVHCTPGTVVALSGKTIGQSFELMHGAHV
jgi:hypothetical protein